MKEMVGGCCVCSDDRGWSENPLVYCDGQSCTVAVHQACYGIVTVPTGPWYCRKCESQERTARVKCELCPSKYGALKRTDNSGWAHVVCALYIPEVRFGNVTTMEPIQLQLIPPERFSKVCYICEEQSKPANASIGACMQCNKAGCKQQFHVTCAQALGLLCEEAGNYLDNVKYCGYCQHHYSKLKKGGNVKPIPPYKPVSTENNHSDSSHSEKDPEKSPADSPNLKSAQLLVAPGKRSKAANTKSSTNNSARSSSTSKLVTSTPLLKTSSGNTTTNNIAGIKLDNKDNKSKIFKGAKSEDSSVVLNISAESLTSSEFKSVKETKTELESLEPPKTEIIKELKSGKKRKSISRTPTPITIPIVDNTVIPAANLSVIIPELSASVLSGITSSSLTEKRDIIIVDGCSPDKIRKISVKSETTPATTTASINSPSPSTTPISPSPLLTSIPVDQGVSAIPAAIIQTTSTLPTIASLVVSVPLLNTNLSPQNTIPNQTSVVTSVNPYQQEYPTQDYHPTHSLSNSPIPSVFGGQVQTADAVSPDMSGDGELKIVYEKQIGAESPPEITTAPAKRSRSMSGEKNEKVTRGGKKRNPPPQTGSRRASRSQHVTPSPEQSNIIPVNQIKESPPSSPSSDGGPPTTRSAKAKGKKNAAAASSTTTSTSSTPKDTKDNIKMFQNGLTAPHMLGNQLNPNSHMAQKMADHLNSEIEAHSIYNPNEQSNLIGPQLHHRVIANVRSNSTGGSSTASGASGFSMLGSSSGNIPQTLDQLLERQWEQGSQFLMEQAQHFDIASLLSCLHQLRAENLRLEEHVSSLLQRRDHLLAVNARLAIPLTGQPATPQSSHPHTVNNIHPAVVANHGDLPRQRHSSSYPHVQSSHHSSIPVENGLSSDSNQGYALHRSPIGNQPQTSSPATFRNDRIP